MEPRPLRSSPLLKREKRRERGAEAQSETRVVLFGNDPSAGSPTETLLRLLLPLNDPV